MYLLFIHSIFLRGLEFLLQLRNKLFLLLNLLEDNVVSKAFES